MEKLKKNQRPFLSPTDKRRKKMITRAKVLMAFTIIVMILLIALLVAFLIDTKTPQIVYFIGGILLSGTEVVLCNVCSWYSKKIKTELGIVGDDSKKSAFARKSAADYPLKDKVYKILTCIGFVGDVLLIVSVVFLMREADVPEAVAVISILLGALIAIVFHIAATVRFFRRKRKTEQFPNSSNGANGL